MAIAAMRSKIFGVIGQECSSDGAVPQRLKTRALQAELGSGLPGRVLSSTLCCGPPQGVSWAARSQWDERVRQPLADSRGGSEDVVPQFSGAQAQALPDSVGLVPSC